MSVRYSNPPLAAANAAVCLRAKLPVRGPDKGQHFNFEQTAIGQRSHNSAANDNLLEQIRVSHSITSSAVARSWGWISMPSALAVLRLMTNSNLLDWTTGRS